MAWVKVDADGDINFRPHVVEAHVRLATLGESIEMPILVWMPAGAYGSHIRQVY